MAQTSFGWPGDSGAGGVGDCGPYTANAYTDLYERLFTSSSVDEAVIPNIGNELAVTGSATPLSVNTGAALVNGKWYNNSAAVSLAISTPAASTRIDRVILRVDYTLQTVRLVLLAGAEGGAAPTLTQTDGTTWEVSLAQASITTGGVVTITNERVFLHFNTDIETAMIEDSAVTAVKIANRTRTILVQAPSAYNYTDSIDLIGAQAGWTMIDAKLTLCYAWLQLPPDWVSGLTVKAVVESTASGYVYTTGNVRVGKAGQAYTTHSDSKAGGVEAVTANQIAELCTVTPSSLEAGDYLHMLFQRDATQVGDDTSVDLYFKGFLVSYTADS